MLIGLYSPAPGSGKTTAADYLVQRHGFTRLSFAEPLKDMIRILLENFGYSPADAHHMTHVSKQAPLPEIDSNLDTRHLLRTLGTEWGRDCVHPKLWLRCWSARYMRLIADGITDVVVDDMRFINEAALIDRYGGELWTITRPGTSSDTTHRSEGGLDTLPEDYSLDFSHRLQNDAGLDELYTQLDAIMALGTTALI